MYSDSDVCMCSDVSEVCFVTQKVTLAGLFSAFNGSPWANLLDNDNEH